MITGVEVGLNAAKELNASQSSELADLKKVATSMTRSHQLVTQDLQSSTAQLEHAQTQLSQLTTETQQLQQRYDAQVACCAELESQLHERMQAQNDATSAAQQELQGVCSLPMCCSQTPESEVLHSQLHVMLCQGL